MSDSTKPKKGDKDYNDGSHLFFMIFIAWQFLAVTTFLWLGNQYLNFGILVFFSLGGLAWSLGRAYSDEHKRIENIPRALANFSLFLIVFGLIILMIQFFELTHVQASTDNKIILFDNIKTLEGGLLAITALIITIVSSIYIWSLQTTKLSAEKIIRELVNQKIEVDKSLVSQKNEADKALSELQSKCIKLEDIPRLDKSIEKVREELSESIREVSKNLSNSIHSNKIASLAADRTPHLQLLHRIVINQSQGNATVDKYAKHLHMIMSFEIAAFDLIDYAGNFSKFSGQANIAIEDYSGTDEENTEINEQINAVRNLLLSVEDTGAGKYLSEKLVTYLARLLEESAICQADSAIELVLDLKQFCIRQRRETA